MSSQAQKLAKRIEKYFGIKVIPIIYRTRAGYYQKAHGAWSWFMLTEDNREVGSANTVLEVLQSKDWEEYSQCIGQTEILI